MTHTINKFAFGEAFPGLRLPLDGDRRDLPLELRAPVLPEGRPHLVHAPLRADDQLAAVQRHGEHRGRRA